MKINDNVLTCISEDDLSDNGKLVIPDGVEEIARYSIRTDERIRSIEIPKSMKKIDSEAFQYLVNLVSLYVPDGIKELDIQPYMQQRSKVVTEKASYWCWDYLVNQWEFLRLPKGFKIKSVAENDIDILEEATLIVSLENLERILEENKYDGENVILNIRDASELSVDKLKKFAKMVNMQSVQIIDIKGQSLCHETFMPYDIETYIKCRNKIDELLGSIDLEKYEQMPDREKYIFGEIIRKLSNISYDKCAFREGNNSKRCITCRNLVGGLLDETCVCVGYSEILRNVLSCCNIESKLIAGGGHCWNQVKLDGKWYNVDLTFDQPKVLKGKTPKFLLKSDKDFKRHSKMIIDYIRSKKDSRSSIMPQIHKEIELEKCDETIPNDELMKYIYGKYKILEEKSESDDSRYYVPLQQGQSLEIVEKYIRKNKVGFSRILETFNKFRISRKRDKDGENKDSR